MARGRAAGRGRHGDRAERRPPGSSRIGGRRHGAVLPGKRRRRIPAKRRSPFARAFSSKGSASSPSPWRSRPCSFVSPSRATSRSGNQCRPARDRVLLRAPLLLLVHGALASCRPCRSIGWASRPRRQQSSTAVVTIVNVAGNLAAGWLLQRGMPRVVLIVGAARLDGGVHRRPLPRWRARPAAAGAGWRLFGRDRRRAGLPVHRASRPCAATRAGRCRDRAF